MIFNINGLVGGFSGINGTVLVKRPGPLIWTSTNGGYLAVGYYGTGQLTIQNGGMVSNNDAYIVTRPALAP